MALNKLENQIKEKLNSREIQPSVQAWDRLDAMLSVAENKKPKRKINWLVIAAVFVGFAILGTIFINKNKEITTVNENVVLETPKPETPKIDKPKYKGNINPNPVLIQTINNNQVAQVLENKKLNASKPIIKKEGVSIINNYQNQIAVISKTENLVVIPNKEEVISTQKEINIDALLATVKPSIEKPKPTIKVNPSSLLSQVDGELRTEYKENIFQKISNKYQTVKVALSERNLQK
jgi:hypothetical protein